MKHIKKMIALVMMAALLLSMGGRTAYADGENTYNFVVKQDQDQGYEYLLYQMLKGDIAVVDGKQVFSNVEWGNGVKEETKTAMYDMAGLADANRTASKFAEWLGKQNSTVFHQMISQVGVHNGSSLQNATTLTFGSYSIKGETVKGFGADNLQGGYYLVRNTEVPTGKTFSDYIVFVLNEDTQVSPKSASAPTPEKKVTDKNDSWPTQEGAANATGDSADYDIGDSVPYTLSVQLPPNYADYVAYKLVFKDEMSKGLTYNKDARIYYGANDTTGTAITLTETAGSSHYLADGKTYTYEISDLKTQVASSYGLTGGSLIRITYTATLNKYAVIGSAGNPNVFKIEYSNDPTGTSTGETEEDETTVFTFKLVFNKVDDKNKPLSGADFVLYKYMAESNSNDKWIDVTTLGTNDNRPTKTKSGADGKTDCVFTFSGLDDGLYKLHESATPAGYNSISDFEFTVSGAHDVTSATPQLKGLTGGNAEISFTMTSDVAAGQLSADVKNESGATLPTTGAEGTMLLVFGGTLIALIGIVILVTRRRMRAV